MLHTALTGAVNASSYAQTPVILNRELVFIKQLCPWIRMADWVKSTAVSCVRNPEGHVHEPSASL